MSEPGVTGEPGPVREEAERLVAAALAAVSTAARGTSGYATGSAECCVCPLCRVIAAMRDPNPEVAERLATGAGDLAAGVASLLRSFGGPRETSRPEPERAQRSEPEPAAPDPVAPDPVAPEQVAPEQVASEPPEPEPGDDPWRAATRG
jgi:hypothetical protein